MDQSHISNQAPKAKSGWFLLITSFRWEAFAIAIVFVAFLLLNLATYSIYPFVAHDEVMFSDPALNLYLGNGFTSTAWEFQTKEEFWAGNAPLYSILLSNWMHLFGSSIIAIRALNYVLMILSGLAIWLAVIRLNLVTSAWSRVSLITLILLSDGVFFAYRTGRYDGTTIFLCAAALLVCSVPSPWLRCVFLSCIGIFLPIAGLHLAAYTVVFCSLLLVYLRRSFVKETVSLAIGSAIGVVFLYVIYSTNSVWTHFLIGTLGAHHSITGKLGQAIVLKKTKHLAAYNDIFLIFVREYSFPLLLALAIGIAIYQFRKGKFKIHSPLSFGLATSFAIPIGVFLLGKYPIYYVWMALIPLAICLFSTLDASKFNPKNGLHWLIVGVLVLTCLVGLPRRLALMSTDVTGKDYAQLEELVNRNVTKNDWVMCDYGAYYAAKKTGATVILPNYTESSLFPTIPEREKISILIVEPSTFETVLPRLGGEWQESGARTTSDLKEYTLQVYKRKST